MMKKGMIRFLAAGMTALTLMGTAAFTPATQVFAAETEIMDDACESTHEFMTMSAREANAYVKELVGDTVPYYEIGHTKMYRIGNYDYSIRICETVPEIVKQDFEDAMEAEQFYLECLNKDMVDVELNEYLNTTIDGYWVFDHATVVGYIPTVNLTIDIFTI